MFKSRAPTIEALNRNVFEHCKKSEELRVKANNPSFSKGEDRYSGKSQ